MRAAAPPRARLSCMGTDLQEHKGRPPIVRKAAAGLVLVVAALLAVKLAIGLVTAVFTVLLVVAVVIAIAWALKTIVW